MKRILIVDDEESICRSILGILSDEGYDANSCNSGEKAIKFVDENFPDLVLLDIWMQGIDGLDTLRIIKKRYPNLPVVIMSGHGTIETAVKATKLGAFEFIEKPISLDRLLLCVKNGLAIKNLKEENQSLKRKVQNRYELIGGSQATVELREQIELVAKADRSILITGENGTGKEIVAHRIHQMSERSTRAMIEVNCAAIPEDLIESELFGYEKGAFTGAAGRKNGKFDQAHKGILFLDEIADMTLKTQAKVLRIIQEKHFERVGGNTVIEVDVRIIAATNKNLETEIKQGRFREDLYYRLNVIPFYLVPLRDRIDDIPPLVDYFLSQFAAEQNVKQKTIDEEAILVLKSYGWPGNVRELKNIIERMVIMTRSREMTRFDLPPSIRDQSPSEQKSEVIVQNVSMKEAKAAFEAQFIRKRLVENNWNVSRTAEAIGLERSNLHRKIKQYNIDVKK